VCRFLAYAAHRPTPLTSLLGPGGLDAFLGMAPWNRDGWGMGWYDAQGRAQVQKSVRTASDDPAFVACAGTAHSDVGIVHLRAATPGLAVEPHNTHPFQHGDLLMAHNGAIYPQDRLDELVPPGYAARLRGTTDSERYMLAVLAGVEQGLDVVDAIDQAVHRISSAFAPSSLNALLLTPSALYAVGWHEPSRLPSIEFPGPMEQYFDLRYRVDDDAVVVASTGWPQEEWEVLPNHHVLVVDRATLAVDRFALPLPPAASAAS
jgi:predicted glutamine amidotransferase